MLPTCAVFELHMFSLLGEETRFCNVQWEAGVGLGAEAPPWRPPLPRPGRGGRRQGAAMPGVQGCQGVEQDE